MFDISPNKNKPPPAKVRLNYDVSIPVPSLCSLHKAHHLPLLPLKMLTGFMLIFLLTIGADTHTVADIPKLSHRCLSCQYEHIDLSSASSSSVSLRFLFLLSISQFIHEKVSLGLVPSTQRKDKIFYWGECKFTGRKRFSCIYSSAMITSVHIMTAI